MRNNRSMSEPALAPRNAFHGVVAVWIVALLTSIALGIFVAEDLRVGWLLISFGGIVLLSFAVQLWYARPQGFIVRVAGSVVGSLMLMGLVSVGFGLAALATVVES